MNAAIIGGLVVAAALAGTAWLGYEAGKDAVVAEQEQTRKAVADALENARKGTADAIAGLRPQVQVINQKVRETVRVEPVYRECVHAPGVLDDINRALTGTGPAGGERLPRADPPQ